MNQDPGNEQVLTRFDPPSRTQLWVGLWGLKSETLVGPLDRVKIGVGQAHKTLNDSPDSGLQDKTLHVSLAEALGCPKASDHKPRVFQRPESQRSKIYLGQV